jgi:PDZ domain-containing protein
MPEIDPHGVTGPSGGLMLALAVTDSLNPGDLTGGRTIAGTGTIDRDGDVGPIGSVSYKVRGAAAAGATVFFVPADDAAEAAKAAPATVRVIPVATYADALGWLCAGGSADHACATASAGRPG